MPGPFDHPGNAAYLFPMEHRTVCLDHNATTPLHPRVRGEIVACLCAREEMEETAGRLAVLKEILWAGILRAVPDAVRNGDPAHGLPGTLHVSLPGVEGEALTLRLDLYGVRVSTGSACAAGLDEPSATLSATGVSRALARSSVRFSLGRATTREDIGYVLSILPAALRRPAGK